MRPGWLTPLITTAAALWFSAAAHAAADASAAPQTNADATPTYAGGIAAIVYNNCTPCHRDGGGAPMHFTSYEEVRKRARLIAHVTEDRIMPPWKAEKGDVAFLNERHLPEADIAALRAWFDAGAPLGDPDAVPELPSYPSDWHLGEPDLILQMEEDFTVPADGPDIYRGFVVRIPDLPEGTYLKGLDYRPKAKLSAHHTLFSLDTTGEARARSEASERPGFGGMESNLSLGRIGGWAVGSLPNLYPEGVAIALRPGTDLVLATHFHPGGKEETERAEIGLYLTTEPPVKHMVTLDTPFAFGLLAGIRIPPGESNYIVREQFTMPADATLFGISPHAHYIATSMRATATLPDGTSMTIINVPRWDFAWQEQYRLAEPLALPKGTRFDMEFSYDNSTANPNNPYNPPAEITFGPETTDEMACMTLAFMSDTPEAIDELRRGYVAWVKEEIATADLSMVVGSANQQRRDALDLNSDGTITPGEIYARVKTIRSRIANADPESLHLQILPAIGARLFTSVVLPWLLPRVAVVLAATLLAVYFLFRWRRSARERKRLRTEEIQHA
jgi:hypothetical protein